MVGFQYLHIFFMTTILHKSTAFAKSLAEAKADSTAPEWMTEEGYATLVGKDGNSYLLPNETVSDMYLRMSTTAYDYLLDMYTKAHQALPDVCTIQNFFEIFWKGWLGGATPVLSNFGAKRGLPISCYSSFMDDNLNHIIDTISEVGKLSAKGGGTAVHLSAVRPAGSPISTGGTSDGIVSPLRMLNATCESISQTSIRRGAVAVYLDVEHGDIHEFLRIRRAAQDASRRFMSLHQGVCISDEFMHRVKSGDKEARSLWLEIIKTRVETGEPYLFFKDTVNRLRPDCYKQRNLYVTGSNLCSEIVGYTDALHTFVCCLSSLNLAKYDEWKDTPTVELSILFLEAVMEEFIQKASSMSGFDRAIRFAVKSRMLGLGAMGYHTYLQENNIAFNSDLAKDVNKEIFAYIKERADYTSAYLATDLGEPEWCEGSGYRHTHRMSLAPTVSNSTICGGISPSIEPYTANIFSKSGAKGVFIVRNPSLEKVLNELNLNTQDIWESIAEHSGSVQHLDFLSEWQKQVYLTAREIDQTVIVEQAADRQKFLDQTQSVNLFFHQGAELNYINKVHLLAWELGVPTLYYFRSQAAIKVTSSARSAEVTEPTPVTVKECSLKPVVDAGDNICIPCGG